MGLVLMDGKEDLVYDCELESSVDFVVIDEGFW